MLDDGLWGDAGGLPPLPFGMVGLELATSIGPKLPGDDIVLFRGEMASESICSDIVLLRGEPPSAATCSICGGSMVMLLRRFVPAGFSPAAPEEESREYSRSLLDFISGLLGRLFGALSIVTLPSRSCDL